MKANDLHNFSFTKVSSGCYKVTYITDNRGDFWIAYINDMTLIDATKNAEWAKAKDIEILRDEVKRCGKHYNSHGQVIE